MAEHLKNIHESSTMFDPEFDLDDMKLKIILKVEFYRQNSIVNDSNATFDFIIEKMNQVPCPIWEHFSGKLNYLKSIHTLSSKILKIPEFNLIKKIKIHSNCNIQKRYFIKLTVNCWSKKFF